MERKQIQIKEPYDWETGGCYAKHFARADDSTSAVDGSSNTSEDRPGTHDSEGVSRRCRCEHTHLQVGKARTDPRR
jgi:hypothetical protein